MGPRPVERTVGRKVVLPQERYAGFPTYVSGTGQIWIVTMAASYEQRASECLRHARVSPGSGDRAVWRELALCWLRLADLSHKFREDVTHVTIARDSYSDGTRAA